MKTYTFIISRVYETLVKIESTSQQDALKLLHELDVQAIEAEQNCIVEQNIYDDLGNQIDY